MEIAPHTRANVVAAEDGIEMREDEVAAGGLGGDAAALRRREVAVDLALVGERALENQQIGATAKLDDAVADIRVA